MTSIRNIVTRGFRESGIIETGGEPSAEEFEEGLVLLQGLYSSFFGNELGEQLESVNYGTSGLTNSYAVSEDKAPYISTYYVPSNIRLILNLSSPQTLYLNPNPRDGARLGIIDNADNVGTYNVTINGNGRQIESANTVVLNTNLINREWFYRADLGTWTRLTDLDENGVSPLPREFDDLLQTALAIRINPRFGAQTAQETADILNRMKKQFRARYRQVMQQRSEDGIVRLPGNRAYWGMYSSTNAFNKGI